ncbi:MAG: c-type cytochrome [Acidimicrobiales bacterium]
MSERPKNRREAEARRRATARRWRLLAGVAAVVLGFGAIVAVVAVASGPSKPLEDGVDDQALGAQVFSASCATCHGPELLGTFVGPPLVDEIYAPDHHDDDAIRAAIANGVEPHHWDFAAMPPIPGLDAAEVDAVIGHIRAVQGEAGIGGEAAP